MLENKVFCCCWRHIVSAILSARKNKEIKVKKNIKKIST